MHLKRFKCWKTYLLIFLDFWRKEWLFKSSKLKKFRIKILKTDAENYLGVKMLQNSGTENHLSTRLTFLFPQMSYCIKWTSYWNEQINRKRRVNESVDMFLTVFYRILNLLYFFYITLQFTTFQKLITFF